MKKLLREFYKLCDNGVCQDLLTEEERVLVKSGTPILTGVIQRADARNGNGRIYPRAILEREIERYQELVKTRRALAECDHPDRETVELKSVSHLVREIFWDGDDVIGKIEVLSTPQGQILRSLIKDGIPLGISSRGLGSVRESKEGIIVDEDYKLVAFDVVWEPSVQGAFQRPINETLEIQQSLKFEGINQLLNDILNSKKS